jgi:proline dehydrogenase
VRAVFGTHDTRLLRAIADHAAASGRPPRDVEFHLLYGIQRAEQQRLARAGHTVRVLVSYGSYWFPWYMRRLAERPANVLFVARSLFRA